MNNSFEKLCNMGRGKFCILGGIETLIVIPPTFNKGKDVQVYHLHLYTSLIPFFLRQTSPSAVSRLISPPPGLNIPFLWQPLSFISSFFNL